MNQLQIRGLLAAMFALTPVGLNAQAATAYADVDALSHSFSVSLHRQRGDRMLSLAVSGTESDPRYTAVWAHRAGPPWVSFHGLDRAAYTTFHVQQLIAGFRPQFVSAIGSATTGSYAGVYVQDGIAARHVWAVTGGALATENTTARDAGMTMTSLAAHGSGLQRVYTAVWEPTPHDGGYNYTVADDQARFDERSQAYQSIWTRPSFVTVSPEVDYAAIWRDDVLAGPWIVRHGLTKTALLNLLQQQQPLGYYPLSIGAGGAGSATRFAALLVQTEQVQPKQWRTPTGSSVPGFDAFDAYVRNLMQQTETRAGALAIGRNGRLVYARGYTNAETGYPTTQPQSMFRVASCSKVITATAVHQEFARGRGLGLSTRLTQVLPVVSSLVQDQRLFQVDMAHLLSHQAGWDFETLGFDPVNRDAAVASWAGTPLPIDRDDVYGYMSYTRGQQFAPGTDWEYSNYGMSLLGSVLERSNPGMTYEQIVQRDLFQPLGLSRPALLQPFVQQQRAGAVRYHPRIPEVIPTVLQSQRPLLPGNYGGFNPWTGAPAGAWEMAAPDFVKLLTAFDLGNANPILDQAWTDVMWTTVAPTIKPDQLRGWFSVPLPDEHGVTRNGVQHNGLLGGTAALIVRREDGLSFALFLNRDVEGAMHAGIHGRTLNSLANQIAQWPSHDLFPSVGIINHQLPCPQLTGTSVAGVFNVARTSFKLVGQHLQHTTKVRIGAIEIVNQSDDDVGDGRFRILSDTEVSVIPPQGMDTGSYQVWASNGACWSSGRTIQILPNLSPSLVAPTRIDTGNPFRLFGAKGTGQAPTSQLWLALSASNVPSNYPGIVTLGLGNQFADLLVWPSGLTAVPSSGAVTWQAPGVPGLFGLDLYFEFMSLDLGSQSPLPLPTSNTVLVEFR